MKELDSTINKSEKKIDDHGQPVIVRELSETVSPKEDLHVEVEDLIGKKHLKNESYIFRKINDPHRPDSDDANTILCDQVFKAAPLFVYEREKRNKPKILRLINPFIKINRSLRLNPAEDARLKVIYDSSIHDKIDKVNKSDNRIILRSNTFSENTGLSQKKLEEMIDKMCCSFRK